MKVNNVKFVNSILFDGVQVSFFDSVRHKVEMDFDAKNGVLTILNTKDTVLVPATNLIYMKVA